MADYLKIYSPVGGKLNSGLKKAITYIGKHYGKLENKEGYKNKEYFKYGRKYIAKQCKGNRCETAILYMVKPDKTKNPDNRLWRYHKRIYMEAYEHIINSLRKCPPSDKDIVKELLNDIYLDICKRLGEDNKPARLCSNALLFWQKDMLDFYNNMPNVSIYYRDIAGKILSKIKNLDNVKPIDY